MATGLVLDLDLKSFFDSVSWDLVLKAVAHHSELRWVLLYAERWLKAPLQLEVGSLVERDRGTPQGSAISPLLANMFLHYAFDASMKIQAVRALLEQPRLEMAFQPIWDPEDGHLLDIALTSTPNP